MDLPMTASAVVIGGGVVGCSIAYNLARRGLGDVVVVERDTVGSGTTRKAAGGIRVQFPTETEILCTWAERENRPGEAGVLRTAVPSTGPLSRLCSSWRPASHCIRGVRRHAGSGGRLDWSRRDDTRMVRRRTTG
jgi:choline dehydrogenase-like flavoprotein